MARKMVGARVSQRGGDFLDSGAGNLEQCAGPEHAGLMEPALGIGAQVCTEESFQGSRMNAEGGCQFGHAILRLVRAFGPVPNQTQSTAHLLRLSILLSYASNRPGLAVQMRR